MTDQRKNDEGAAGTGPFDQSIASGKDPSVPKSAAPEYTIIPVSPNRDNPSLVDQLCDLVEQKASLWKHENGTAFATIPIDTHVESHGIISPQFESWINKLSRDHFGSRASSYTIREVMDQSRRQALTAGPIKAARLRVARHDDKTYIDIGDASHGCIEVDPWGWRILPTPPVPLVRSSNTASLPIPVAGGDVLDLLRPYLNAEDDDTRRLIIAYIMFALQGAGPFPLVAVQGRAGSAKSTIVRMMRRLIDPVHGDGGGLMRPPKNEETLRVHAFNSYLVPYDNLSGIRPEIADALCSLVTGGDFGGRKLYHDNEMIACSLMRPVILNGIDNILNRDDLADRSLWIHTPDIPDGQKVRSQEFWADFDQDAPAIFGALLDALSATMRVAVGRLPGTGTAFRMGDFADFLQNAEMSLGWSPGEGQATYRRTIADAAQKAVAQDPVAKGITIMMQGRSSWTGSTSELLLILQKAVECGDLEQVPANAIALGKKYDRLKPVLAKIGLHIDRTENSGASIWTITRRRPMARVAGVAGVAGFSPFLEEKEEEIDPRNDRTRRDEVVRNLPDLPHPPQFDWSNPDRRPRRHLEECLVTGDDEFGMSTPTPPEWQTHQDRSVIPD